MLVVAPHPDDETIGPGGTIARLAAAGAEVHVLAVSVRAGAMWGGVSDPGVRLDEFEAACAVLGVSSCEVAWRCDAGDLDVTQRQRDLVALIEHDASLSISTIRPHLFLIPSASGFHQDHLAVHRAAFAAARFHPPGLKPTPSHVLGYGAAEEVWSTGSEAWTVQVDTTDFWSAKLDALKEYGSQIRPIGPRSLENIRLFDAARGASINVSYAEAFVPYRVLL